MRVCPGGTEMDPAFLPLEPELVLFTESKPEPGLFEPGFEPFPDPGPEPPPLPPGTVVASEQPP